MTNLTFSDRCQLWACGLGILIFGLSWLLLLANDWNRLQKPVWPWRIPFFVLAAALVLILSSTAIREALRGL